MFFYDLVSAASGLGGYSDKGGSFFTSCMLCSLSLCGEVRFSPLEQNKHTKKTVSFHFNSSFFKVLPLLLLLVIIITSWFFTYALYFADPERHQIQINYPWPPSNDCLHDVGDLEHKGSSVSHTGLIWICEESYYDWYQRLSGKKLYFF